MVLMSAIRCHTLERIEKLLSGQVLDVAHHALDGQAGAGSLRAADSGELHRLAGDCSSRSNLVSRFLERVGGEVGGEESIYVVNNSEVEIDGNFIHFAPNTLLVHS